MKNKLTDNLLLKIGSVLFAAALWFIVTNINDPATPQKFYNVPVEIRNTELITDQGKIYEVLEGTNVIDVVNVVAPRSIIDTIRKENIIAVADMSNLTNLNTIKIDLSTNKYNEKLDDITGSIENVKLNIEDKKKIQLALRTSTSGSVEEGYMVGDIAPEQNLVNVSGPESVVSRISKAEVNVAVTGFTSDIGTDAEIKLYDAEGAEISKKNLTLNINSVRVKVEILATTQVPVVFSTVGTPASGYRATGVISSSQSSIKIAGKANVIKNVSSIEVPDSVLDIAGLTENLETVINIKDYLPGSVELADSGFDGNITVVAYIEPEAVRNIVISEEDIVILNMPEGYEGRVGAFEEEFTIQVRGLAADVNAIAPEQIQGIVDINTLLEKGSLEEVKEGDYDVPLSFNLPENVDLKDRIIVRLNIREN